VKPAAGAKADPDTKPQDKLAAECDAGKPEKCVELGDFHRNWDRDEGKAKAAYKKACDIGYPEGCEKFKKKVAPQEAEDGVVVFDSRDVKPNSGGPGPVTEAGLRRECESDKNFKSCNDLGLFFVRRLKAERDYPEARRFFRMACDGAETEGCNNLGYMYDIGDGVERDHQKALELYTMSCDNGNADGCGKLGFLLDNGDYKVRNREKAAKVLAKACDGGSFVGCTNLGITLVDQPDRKLDAKKHFEKACDNNYARGCTMLGLMHSIGDGIPQDFGTANELFDRGCKAGHMGGCVGLGRAYMVGEGFKKDRAKSKQWFQMACDGGSRRGCRLLTKVSGDAPASQPK
jgi:TPR repeat protein